MTNLSGVEVSRKSGHEAIHNNGRHLGRTLDEFWEWSSSNLVGNALRGLLAEYIVALALGCDDGVRQEWDAFDLQSAEGLKIEVKSAAWFYCSSALPG